VVHCDYSLHVVSDYSKRNNVIPVCHIDDKFIKYKHGACCPTPLCRVGQHFPQPHSFSRHWFLTCPLLPTSTALVFIHEHTYTYHAIMTAWHNLKEKVNLCSHYGTFRHSLQSTKQCHISRSCVASGTTELDF